MILRFLQQVKENRAAPALIIKDANYMIPSKYLTIDEMPLNNSGKIDSVKLKTIE